MKPRLILLPLLAGLAACGSDRDLPSADAGKRPTPVNEALDLNAEGLPRFRAGLWEVVSRRGAETEIEQVCRAAGVDPELHEYLAGPAGPGCQKTRSDVGGRLQVSMQCFGPGSKLEMSIGLQGSDSRYSLTISTAVTGSDGSRSVEAASAEARWLSACPAGTAAGDVVD